MRRSDVIRIIEDLGVESSNNNDLQNDEDLSGSSGAEDSASAKGKGEARNTPITVVNAHAMATTLGDGDLRTRRFCRLYLIVAKPRPLLEVVLPWDFEGSNRMRKKQDDVAVTGMDIPIGDAIEAGTSRGRCDLRWVATMEDTGMRVKEVAAPAAGKEMKGGADGILQLGPWCSLSLGPIKLFKAQVVKKEGSFT